MGKIAGNSVLSGPNIPNARKEGMSNRFTCFMMINNDGRTSDTIYIITDLDDKSEIITDEGWGSLAHRKLRLKLILEQRSTTYH